MNWKGATMVLLEKMKMHTVTRGNYVTSVNGMIHPNRIMKEHDFLYMLDGNWEIFEDGVPYLMTTDDLLILPAGRHHYGKKMCNPGNRHMYIHVLPTEIENFFNTSQLKTDMKYTPASASDMFSCPSLLHCQAATRIRQYFLEPDTRTGKPAFSAFFSPSVRTFPAGSTKKQPDTLRSYD